MRSFIGVGASNSGCNPRPIRTIVYRLGFITTYGEDDVRSISDGLVETRYCDGFMAAHVPISKIVEGNSRTKVSIRISDVEIRKIGFGFGFEDESQNFNFIRKLELISDEDRADAEKKIGEMIHEVQFAGRHSLLMSALEGKPSPFVDLEKRIFELLDSYPKSEEGTVDSQMKCKFCIKTEPCMELTNGPLLPSPEPRRTSQAG